MLGGNAKNVGNQFGDVENQVGNLGKAVEIKQESNRNGKLKDWGEVKGIENEHICKKVLLIQINKIYFQFYFGHISTTPFCFYIDFGQGNTGQKS